LPDDDRFVRVAQFIEAALATEEVGPVRKACGMFLASAAEFYGVAVPEVRVLRVCPIRVREGDWGTELFGDYRFDEKLIRVWMRRAIQQRVISFGTFFRRLPMSLPSPRRGALRVFGDAAYAPLFRGGGGVVPPCSGTPAKRLVWRPFGRGRYRIDWARMNRG
jgi:hypothetical protein